MIPGVGYQNTIIYHQTGHFLTHRSEFPLRQIPVRILPQGIIWVADVLANSLNALRKLRSAPSQLPRGFHPSAFGFGPAIHLAGLRYTEGHCP